MNIQRFEIVLWIMGALASALLFLFEQKFSSVDALSFLIGFLLVASGVRAYALVYKNLFESKQPRQVETLIAAILKLAIFGITLGLFAIVEPAARMWMFGGYLILVPAALWVAVGSSRDTDPELLEAYDYCEWSPEDRGKYL